MAEKIRNEQPIEIDSTWPEMSLERFQDDLLGHFPMEIIIMIKQAIEFELRENEPGYVFNKIDLQKLHPIAEEMRKTCLNYKVTPPKNLPNKLQQQVKKLDSLIAELKQAIIDKKEFKEIYYILKRFCTEGGAPDALLMPEFED